MTALRHMIAREDDAFTVRFLRGAELAAHVTRGLATKASAQQIAQGGGYRVDRCAQHLAASRHAPLARILLSRHWLDERQTVVNAQLDAEWEAWKVKAEVVHVRPKMTPEELLDELTDMAAVGLTFGEVSEHYDVSPETLRRRIRTANLRHEACNLFPDRFKLTAGDLASAA